MKVHHFVLAVCLFFIVSASLLYGQGGAGGTILGTVTDSSGAVLTSASVDVINTATNVTQHAQTTSSGDFTVPFLSPGTYRVTVQSPGFQKSVADGITLVVGQRARVDITMKAGATSEIVDVQSSAVTLETDSAAVSQLVSQRQVENLPLNGRSFLQLLFIGAGAVQTGGEQATMRSGQGAAISINGSRPESNNYLLDGMLNTDQALNTPAVVLSVDAIQEFKVLSETYSAQYGFAANQISIVSKGGSNELHGAGFWFGRNDAVDAQNYFHAPGTPVDALRQNQFGFVVGGPVILPKLYNGRNKTFFLGNYEGWRIRQGSSGFAHTPDPANLSGLFTTLVTDPVAGTPFAGCTSGGVTYASCIPPGRFSRVAKVGLANGFFPAPNCDPATCGGNNYRLSLSLPATTNQQTYRLDQELGRWGKIFGRGTYISSTSSLFNTASGQIGTGTFAEQGTNWAVSHTISLGNSAVNQFSFGRLNANTVQGGFPAPKSVVADLGFTGIFSNLSDPQRVFPNIQWGNPAGQTTLSNFGGAINAFGTSQNPMWQFTDSLTLIRRSHSVTLGGDYKRWKLDRQVANNFLGTFAYAGFATGNQFADFLLGDYSRAGTNVPGPYTPANTVGNPYEYNFQYFAAYVQDDWKATKRLTLNLGLRWDLRSVPNETHDHFGWIDVTNPLGGVCMADKTIFSSGIAGSSGFYRNCGTTTPAPAEKKNFAPRVGFAWRPFGEKTVIRGGYGLFWDGIEGREIDGSADFYPYVSALSLTQTSGQASYTTTDQLFPNFTAGPVIPGPAGQNSFAVVTLTSPPFLKNPYVQQYTLAVQRELAKATVLELSYVGNKGTHLLTRQQINQAFPIADPAFCAVPANQQLGDCPISARAPFPNFGVYIDDRWQGYSNYNAATAKFEHRTSSLAMSASYTWSKSLDDKSAAAGVGASQFNGWQGFLNNHNQRADYSRSDFDTGQRFVASMVYDLPVGRGKHVLGNSNRALNAVVGGWQLSTIYTAQLGFPMSIQAGDTFGLLNSFGTNRADIVGDPSGPKSKAQWFNTAAFVQPAPNTFGDSSRNSVRMPGINNWDIGLLKNVEFTERARLQLRLETFNTFNHPQFNPDPSIPVFSGGASTVVNNVNSPNFGQITGAAPARIVQLGAKIIF